MSERKPSLDDLRIERHDEEESGGRGRWIVVLLVLVILLAIGWWQRPRAPRVTIAEAVSATVDARGQSGVVLNATGYVVARRKATVSARVTGQVVEVTVEEGMTVSEGQVLARLDDGLAQRALDLSRARLESASRSLDETVALLEEAEANLTRTTRLVEDGVASSADLDAATARRDALAARLQLGRQGVEVAEREVALRLQEREDTVIRAPFDGVAVSKDAQPGEIVSPVSGGGGFTRTGVCTLVDMTSLEIEVDVSESYINRVVPGQRVEAVLDAYPDWRIPASVITTVPTADRQKATVRVRIAFDDLDSRLVPDMGVKVAFLEDPPEQTMEGGEGKKGVVVPASAIRRDGESAIVFVIEGKRLERRAVRLGASRGDRAEILSGLSDGEKVVVDGPAGLGDGDQVEVVEEAGR